MRPRCRIAASPRPKPHRAPRQVQRQAAEEADDRRPRHERGGTAAGRARELERDRKRASEQQRHDVVHDLRRARVAKEELEQVGPLLRAGRPQQDGRDDRRRVLDQRGQHDGRDDRVEDAAEDPAGRDPEVELGEPARRRAVGREPRVAHQRGDGQAGKVKRQQQRERLLRADRQCVHEQDRHRGQRQPGELDEPLGVRSRRERRHEGGEVDRERHHPQQRDRGEVAREVRGDAEHEARRDRRQREPACRGRASRSGGVWSRSRLPVCQGVARARPRMPPRAIRRPRTRWPMHRSDRAA